MCSVHAENESEGEFEKDFGRTKFITRRGKRREICILASANFEVDLTAADGGAGGGIAAVQNMFRFMSNEMECTSFPFFTMQLMTLSPLCSQFCCKTIHKMQAHIHHQHTASWVKRRQIYTVRMLMMRL